MGDRIKPVDTRTVDKLDPNENPPDSTPQTPPGTPTT